MQQKNNNPNEMRILAALDEIKLLLISTPFAPPVTRIETKVVRTPKYVCQTYDISRNTLERYFRNGWLTKISISPESSKIYIAESELLKVFK